MQAVVNTMQCSFAVPIIETDSLAGIRSPSDVLNMLFEKDDTRLQAIKFYLLVGLDVYCGNRSFSLRYFSDLLDEQCTITVAYDAARSMVYMQVDCNIVTAWVPAMNMKCGSALRLSAVTTSHGFENKQLQILCQNFTGNQ